MADSVTPRGLDFHRLFDASPDMCLILDPTFKIVGVNEAHLRATMTTRAGIVGRNVFDVFPDNPDDPGATGAANLRYSLETVVRTKKPHTMAVQKYDIQRPESEGGAFETRYWSVINVPMLDESGQVDLIINRAEDVTEFVMLKEAQRANMEANAQLRAKAAEMEAEVYRRAQEIQSVNRNLGESNRALEAFSYSVSHDLRAPLRSIHGFCTILEEEAAHRLEDSDRERVDRIKQACLKMSEVIESLLRLSRVSRGELVIEEVDVSDLLSSRFAELARDDPRPDATVTVAPGVVVHGDTKLLRVLVDNLAGNAWKFTLKNAVTKIKAGPLEDENGCGFFIRDNGVGFDNEYGSKIFEPFERLHPDRRFEGSGIGLSIVESIVARHGGRVWAEGKVGKGATFYITLPGVDDSA